MITFNILITSGLTGLYKSSRTSSNTSLTLQQPRGDRKSFDERQYYYEFNIEYRVLNGPYLETIRPDSGEQSSQIVSYKTQLII